MRFLEPVVALLSMVSLVSAAPVSERTPDVDQDLPDGLPYPSPSELALVEQHAHGTLPNTSPPPVISNKGITNLQLIAFNELFEVAFFNELITNITENVEGYRFSDADDKSLVLASLKAILAVRLSSISCAINFSLLTYLIPNSKKNFMRSAPIVLSHTSTLTPSSRANTTSL
jgi:hypothetical protein